MKWIHKYKKIILFTAIFIGIMLIICTIFYQPFLNFVSNIDSIQIFFKEQTILGRCLIVLLMILQVIFVFLPGEIIEVLSGYLYGPIEGLILCTIGVLIGSFFIYLLVKKFGVYLIDVFVGMDKIQECNFLYNNEHLILLLFVIYLIPGTPKDIITYFIPLTNVRFTSFICITSLARFPSIITSTICGSAWECKQYEISILVFLITLIVSGVGIYFYKSKLCKT